MNPGLYFAKIPGIPRLDFRVEGAYTDLPNLRANAGYYYWNNKYLSGYTNRGNLLAGWVGRQGRGVQMWSNYWFSPQSKLQFGYRTVTVSPSLLGGGEQHDFSVNARVRFRHDIELGPGVQYERWRFSMLSQLPRQNSSVSMSITWFPDWEMRH
jgi:hypothetical protein